MLSPALIISAGFKEAGPGGAALERRIPEAARNSGIRIIGPDCLGIISPRTRLNASGFSGFVSAGSMVDVGWGDLIRYFAADPNTSCLLLYMEAVGDTLTFLSAAREAMRKPIIVMKAGRSEESTKTTVSHTGLTGRQ